MSACLLCKSQSRSNKLLKLTEIVVDNVTLQDVISQQLQFTPSTWDLACKTCFNSFKIFYQFLNKVKSNLTTFVSVSSQPNLIILKTEPILEPSVKIEPAFIANDDSCHPESDFDWNNDETVDSLMDVDEGSNFELDVPKKAAKPVIKVRYLPRHLVTKEILSKNQEWLVIDGIEYKISKNLLKKANKAAIRAKLEESRRSNPLCYPEGEEKIKKHTEIKCPVCGAESESFFLLKKHIRQSHPGVRPHLLCCNRKFYKRFHLLDHIELIEKSTVHTCHICNKTYISNESLKAHNRNYHPADDKERLICDECGKLFGSASLLRTHMASHMTDESKIFQCYICKDAIVFKNPLQIKSHLRRVHSENKRNREVSCPICSMPTKEANLSKHMKFKHDDKQREKVKCDICSCLVLPVSLKAHMQRHKEMETSCKLCGKLLKSIYTLRVHMKVVHTTNYRFRCEYCDKGFFKRTKMQEHVAVLHTREYPFKCRVEGCDRQYRAETNWRKHEREQHTQEYRKLCQYFNNRMPENLDEVKESI